MKIKKYISALLSIICVIGMIFSFIDENTKAIILAETVTEEDYPEKNMKNMILCIKNIRIILR